MPIPESPKIYHILHWDKLASVMNSDGLPCDAVIANYADSGTTIGMSNIKCRCLRKPAYCHWGTKVADYVPFYFCLRSVMLKAIHNKSRNPHRNADLLYTGGQEPIVHLEADLYEVVSWVNADTRRWAFTNGNAAANATSFYDDLNKLNEIDWDVVLTPHRSGDERNARQAEFLMYGFFPWHLSVQNWRHIA